jgi:hypothetical protein
MPIRLSEFDPKELIDVAKALIINHSESKIRSICNRTYYSCYLTIKKSQRKVKATEKLKHESAYNYLQSKKKKSGALKNYYYDLNRFRVAADYGLHSYQTGVISTSITMKRQPPVDLDAKQTGMEAIKCAEEFIRLYNSR